MEIRITKKLLKEYRKMKQDIVILEMELKDMLESDAGMSSDCVMDYRKGYPKPKSIVGFNWELYEKRKNAMEYRKRKTEAVENFIAQIDNPQTRYVFQMYYINGMGWAAIARKIGLAGREDYVRLHIRNDYLKRMGIR